MDVPQQREAAIFDAALQLPEAERSAYLDQACGRDAALRQRITALLDAHENTDSFLEPPAPAKGGHETAPVSLSPTEKPGDRIGRYKILQQIGEGGCGVVYMAEQEEPVRRRVALKLIKLGMDTKQVVARFEAERQALALMDHPNIAKVLDAGASETGRPYFVMELVRGTKITEYCDQNNLTTQQRLDLFLQVCRAVQHAHQKGIIHRDLKPSNILVTSDDGVPLPKVIDFGIAKATQGRLTDKTVFTAFEQFLGTPAYMSPEQAELNWLDVDTRSDIYSLGVLLYELLTGKTPFDSKELLKAGLDAMRRTIKEQEPERPSTKLSTMLAGELTTAANRRHTEPPRLIHDVRGDLDWIVMKCLEKDRARRYETANGLARDLQRHLDNEAVVARPPSKLYRFQKMVGRNKLAFSAAATVVVSLVVGLSAATWMYFQERAAEHEQVRLRELAQAKEQTAQENERKAQTEAAKSAQVSRFLKDMLQSVEPSVALGRDTQMLREILDETAARVGKDLTNRPEVEAELLSTIGRTYYELHEYSKAETMHRKALQLGTALFGETNQLVGNCMNDLGAALSEQGKNVDAESILRQAMTIWRQLEGVQNAGLATSLHHLGKAVEHQHRLTEAEGLFRQALEMRENLFGRQNPDVAFSRQQLSTVLLRQGRAAEAEPLCREAVAEYKVSCGNEHPSVATALVNLGRILSQQRKLAEAETVLRESVEMRRKNGDDRPPWDLAEVLRKQGKRKESGQIYQEAFAQRTKLSPALLHKLGWRLHAEGQFEEAETVYREALKRYRAPSGNASASDDPLFGIVLHHLAEVLRSRKALAEARSLAEEAVRAYRLNASWEADERQHAFEVLRNALEDLGDAPALEAARREEMCYSLTTVRAAAQTGDVLALNNCAWLLATCTIPDIRDGASAVRFAEGAVAATDRKNGEYLDTLAAAYAEVGEFAKAVSTQKEAIAALQDEREREGCVSRLKLYEAGKPYREP